MQPPQFTAKPFGWLLSMDLLESDVYNIDSHCSNHNSSKHLVHPRTMPDHHIDTISQAMANKTRYKIFSPLMFVDVDDYWKGIERTHISELVHLFSNHYGFVEKCKQDHPDFDPHICASSYTFGKRGGLDDINTNDIIVGWNGWDFTWAQIEHFIHSTLSRIILAIGILLYFGKIWVEKVPLLAILFVVSFLSASPVLFKFHQRHGVDTTAYY